MNKWAAADRLNVGGVGWATAELGIAAGGGGCFAMMLVLAAWADGE
jgi:hypothetical protein